jgi:hypothetical protein
MKEFLKDIWLTVFRRFCSKVSTAAFGNMFVIALVAFKFIKPRGFELENNCSSRYKL